MSTLSDLIDAIRSKAVLLDQENNDDRLDLGALFMKAIQKTVREITKGADTDSFADLTVINLIIMGAEEGYGADEMRVFINELKVSDSDGDEIFEEE